MHLPLEQWKEPERTRLMPQLYFIFIHEIEENGPAKAKKKLTIYGLYQ
jgi:hypothetical protein